MSFLLQGVKNMPVLRKFGKKAHAALRQAVSRYGKAERRPAYLF